MNHSDFRMIYGLSSLLLAAKEGRTKVVRYLIENGADIDATDYSIFDYFSRKMATLQ